MASESVVGDSVHAARIEAAAQVIAEYGWRCAVGHNEDDSAVWGQVEAEDRKVAAAALDAAERVVVPPSPPETRIEVLAVTMFGLGDHAHFWHEASGELQDRYREVVRQLYAMAAYDSASGGLVEQLRAFVLREPILAVESGYGGDTDNMCAICHRFLPHSDRCLWVAARAALVAFDTQEEASQQ